MLLFNLGPNKQKLRYPNLLLLHVLYMYTHPFMCQYILVDLLTLHFSLHVLSFEYFPRWLKRFSWPSGINISRGTWRVFITPQWSVRMPLDQGGVYRHNHWGAEFGLYLEIINKCNISKYNITLQQLFILTRRLTFVVLGITIRSRHIIILQCKGIGLFISMHTSANMHRWIYI